MKKLFLFFFYFLLTLSLQANTVTHLKIEGAIGPSTSLYLSEGFAYALENNSTLILLSLDTPGGLSSSMREMIQEILNTSIPVVIYVSPKGARAASAGTYLMYASHIAVMAPGTNIGAATPINLIKAPNAQDINVSKTSLQKKVINDSVAYIKSLAQLRDRNISWAIDAVKEGKSLSAVDALKKGVINMIAENEDELIKSLEGKRLTLSKQSLTLSLKNAQHLYYKPDWKNRLLSIITNPSIAYILLMLGIYGIFFELLHPGSIYPGIIGLISGVLALYALNILPFSFAGLLLILIGIILMITEVFVSGFGILDLAGLISFSLGSLLLFDADTLGEDISLPLIMGFSISSFAFFILLLRFVLSTKKSKVVSGIEEMLGKEAEVIHKKGFVYQVRCHGEIWSARSDTELQINDIAYVKSISGLILQLQNTKDKL